MKASRRSKVVVLPRNALNAAHLFHAKVVATRGTINHVLCAIRLPKSPEEGISVDLYPSVRQAQVLQVLPFFDITAKYKTGNTAHSIQGKDILGTPISNGYKDGISYFSTFTGKPSELTIVTTLDKIRGQYISRGTFSLTDCQIFNAASIIESSYTGNVRVRRIVVPTFTLNAGIRLMIKYHFESSERTQGETITQSHLVAEFKTTKRVSTASFPDVEEDFNKFLRLTSFAARYRCVCQGWSYSDTGSSHTQHYYQNVTIPKGRVPSVNETLIDVAIYPQFIRKAYSYYIHSGQTGLLDNAIYALTNERATLEDKYTRVFSGLQSLLWFAYRKNGGTKTRVPIKNLFMDFQNSYAVKLDDLWPLFDSTTGVSLYDIRNDLAHGEYIDPRRSSAISYAQENLNWTVERILLTILGWPVEQSKVVANYLRSLYHAHNWQTVRSQW